MTLILAFLAAGALAYLAAGGAQAVLRARRDPLGEFLGTAGKQRSGGALEHFGEQAARYLPGLSVEANLRWAQRGRFHSDDTVGSIMAQALLYSLGGLMLYLVTHSPTGMAAAAIRFVWPLVRLKGKADDVRKRTGRAAPELALLLAAEMAAGAAPEEALRRAATLPGPLSSLVGEAVELSRKTGRPLLSVHGVNGTLMEVFGHCGLPALQVMALQLDMVAAKGIEGAQRMSEIARTLAFEYRQRIMEETEKLEDKLVGLVAAFYFLPMVVLLMGAFFGALKGAF